MIFVKWVSIIFAVSFITFRGSLSGPVALFGFIDLIIAFIPLT